MAKPRRRNSKKEAGPPRAGDRLAGAEAIAEARPARSRWRAAFLAFVALYLATVWLDGVGSNLPARWLPRPVVFFAQYAALFKNAGLMAIDYRAEGWSCAEKGSQKWVEIDVRPWFQIDADNKENRFHRALQFYRKERKVMRALEEYVIRRHNESPDRAPIVGVRFSSIRIPYPEIGSRIERVERRPIASYPGEQRHAWYYTPMSKRRERCGEPSPEKPDVLDGGAPEAPNEAEP